jgi:alkanesulfonate monooxygenase SsuD/methylene tetrahydromethanopterin reductase-like flavin-dependent oxidoreductase (luciferase family)
VIRRAATSSLEDWALVGEPSEVADGIARYREELGVTHLIARAQIPGLARAEIEDSLGEIAQLPL